MQEKAKQRARREQNTIYTCLCVSVHRDTSALEQRSSADARRTGSAKQQPEEGGPDGPVRNDPQDALLSENLFYLF